MGRRMPRIRKVPLKERALEIYNFNRILTKEEKELEQEKECIRELILDAARTKNTVFWYSNHKTRDMYLDLYKWLVYQEGMIVVHSMLTKHIETDTQGNEIEVVDKEHAFQIIWTEDTKKKR